MSVKVRLRTWDSILPNPTNNVDQYHVLNNILEVLLMVVQWREKWQIEQSQ